MLVKSPKIHKNKTGFFLFKKFNGEYLITNDTGEYCFLKPSYFDAFLSGTHTIIADDTYEALRKKGFIRDGLNFSESIQRFSSRNVFVTKATSLHIVVVTLRCDHRCSYCQAGSLGLEAKNLDMDIRTARTVVDRIFESPNKSITIEFQGGEPLANFPVVQCIIEYAKKKNKTAKKDLKFSLVSNLSFMTQERLQFFVKHDVNVSTSLDGPARLHNALRKNKKNNSYQQTTRWIKKLQQAAKKNKKYNHSVGALTTITRQSLPYWKQIIDEYAALGIRGIFLRPVQPFGMSHDEWKRSGVSAEEFVKFYKKALRYILTLNKKGKLLWEFTAKIFLTKILTNNDVNFLDIRSPCGAGIGQLAYNFNGDVYTCDEGRMLSRRLDESFKIGNVSDHSYETMLGTSTVKSVCIASCLDNLVSCSNCVYKPYCGVCPLYNYYTEGDIFKNSSFTCKKHMGILDFLFEQLRDEENKALFYTWELE